jgi:hypothetical protein
MTVVSRRICATPARSASAAWNVIVELATKPGSAARQELLDIEGVASCLIAEESLKTDPCVVFGSGQRLRVYCLHDDEAIVGEKANEAALTFTPTEGDWRMSLPCAADDLAWVQKSLGERSTHVTAREAGTAVDDGATWAGAIAAPAAAVIDREAFLRS